VVPHAGADLPVAAGGLRAAAGLGSRPILIDPVEAAGTRGQVGFELAGWFQFQPIWERISRDNPDIFD
jgi:hypothetical protein